MLKAPSFLVLSGAVDRATLLAIQGGRYKTLHATISIGLDDIRRHADDQRSGLTSV